MPNKHSYDTLVTISSLQRKNILKNLVVILKETANIQQQEQLRPLSKFAENRARDSPFSHNMHIDQRDISAFQRPVYKRPGSDIILNCLCQCR